VSHREPPSQRMATCAHSAARRGDVGFSFGAIRVRTMLDRLRLHLSTERFLAERRRDAVWQAGCETATLALERLASRLCARSLDAPVRAGIAGGELRPAFSRRRRRRPVAPSRALGWRSAPRRPAAARRPR
jgi:hypothetical protein